jgi:hypothetical protein
LSLNLCITSVMLKRDGCASKVPVNIELPFCPSNTSVDTSVAKAARLKEIC